MKKAPLIIFFLLAFLLVNAITKGDYLNPYRVTMFLFLWSLLGLLILNSYKPKT